MKTDPNESLVVIVQSYSMDVDHFISLSSDENVWVHIEIFWLQTWRTWAQFETLLKVKPIYQMFLLSLFLFALHLISQLRYRRDPTGDFSFLWETLLNKRVRLMDSCCLIGAGFLSIRLFSALHKHPIPRNVIECVCSGTYFHSPQRCPKVRWDIFKVPSVKINAPKKKRQDAGTLISSASPQIKRICREMWRDCEGTHDK